MANGIHAQQYTDVLKVSGIMSQGYGLFPKMIAKDKRITIEAKAIYAYFVSYAGAGQIAFPTVETITSDLCISKDRYYNHFRQLTRHGYITVTHERMPGGRFDRNIYTLEQIIHETSMESHVSPCPCFNDTVILPCPDFPCPVNKAVNSNSLNSNTIDPSFIQEIERKNEIADYFKLPESKRDDFGVAVLVEQVEIEYLQLDTIYPGLKDAVVSCLDEMYRCNHISVKGVQVPQEAVRARLAKLSPDGLKHAVMAYLEACRTRTVMNPARYLMSAIFEAQGMVTLRDAADFQRLERFNE